ncbi:hypothetical protein QOZ80_6AG0517070 [Eleusine coracana subsp. coracana]|nr:hypothetical protein QOZ80_6AG0517070 [Eleusine coracana subsp. coracana]
MPAGADNSPAWSLLVGVLSFSAPNNSSLLRLHRFHVARSGRVLGRSGDALEVIDDVDYESRDTSSHISGVTATPSPDDDRSICIFSRDFNRVVPPRPLQLHLNNLNAHDTKISVSTMAGLSPEVISPVMPTRPISGAGDLWAPYITGGGEWNRLVMLQLDKDADRWVQPSHLFFTFDCSTGAWARVVTTAHAKNAAHNYVPIHERGLYVEEDDAIYFMGGGIVWAYRLCKDDQGRQNRLSPPTKVDQVCPFGGEGYGFLTHLGARVLCSVWISTSLGCNCDTLHVIITTFRVSAGGKASRGHFVPGKGSEVLHSTCRRLDMLLSKPSESEYNFCFLQ